MIRDTKLRALGRNPNSPYGLFNYHIIYGCEFTEQTRSDTEMGLFVTNYKKKLSKEPLQPRDALRGGRTNAVKHRISSVLDGWKMSYVDFTR